MQSRVGRQAGRGVAPLALLATMALGLSGCGSGQRQDANEPEGTWKVDIVSVKFPKRQRLAEQARLDISVKNIDSRALPNMAVTVDGFDIRESDPDLADPNRPIWVIDEPPRNADTAFTNTWAAGRVQPGETKTFTWRVTAVRAGTYSVRYRVAAGLQGKARARLADSSIPQGSFTARIGKKPRSVKID